MSRRSTVAVAAVVFVQATPLWPAAALLLACAFVLVFAHHGAPDA